jgi:glyoxylase I family protein
MEVDLVDLHLDPFDQGSEDRTLAGHRLEQPKLVQLRAGASLIELVPASASPGEAGNDAGRNMDHFAVRVDGFDAAALAEHLRRHGVEVGEVRERHGAEGYGPSLYICDPDGNTVELKGPATRGL